MGVSCTPMVDKMEDTVWMYHVHICESRWRIQYGCIMYTYVRVDGGYSMDVSCTPMGDKMENTVWMYHVHL